ncbi:MAG TPA: ribosomal protein S18-alanine N-acetyltransferase [Steroidobacteraceae bacterium]|nr:ribosomal protein S18-alanine N-acetyltransferase [Steroidobacteraceae bacterium]
MASAKREELPLEAPIRAMHEFDVPVVMAIERAGYEFPWSEGIFRDCLRVGYVCRVVDVDGAMAGYGIMATGAGEAHILNVCMREDYRRRGLARGLMLHLLQRARAAGMREAFLEVRPSNMIAAHLYATLGFERVGMRRGYYQAVQGREDAAVLRLLLDSGPN